MYTKLLFTLLNYSTLQMLICMHLIYFDITINKVIISLYTNLSLDITRTQYSIAQRNYVIIQSIN